MSDLLIGIYLTASALAALALVLAFYVVIRRIFVDRAIARRQRLRQKLLGLMLESTATESTESAEPLVAAIRQDPGVAASVLQELSENLRGADFQFLLDRCREAELDTFLIKALKAERRAHRRQLAAETLQFFPGTAVRTALFSALQDEDAEVSVAAGDSLTAQGDIAAARAILDRLDHSQGGASLRLRTIYARCAEQHRDEILRLVADGEASPVMREVGIHALAQQGDLAAVPALLALVDDPSPEIRATAYAALARLGYPDLSGAIGRGLEDPNWQVRASAAEAVGLIGLPDLAEALGRLLADTEWYVRLTAALALVELRENGHEVLERISTSASGSPARIAALVIEENRGMAVHA